jgi:hypothetical protein
MRCRNYRTQFTLIKDVASTLISFLQSIWDRIDGMMMRLWGLDPLWLRGMGSSRWLSGYRGRRLQAEDALVTCYDRGCRI